MESHGRLLWKLELSKVQREALEALRDTHVSRETQTQRDSSSLRADDTLRALEFRWRFLKPDLSEEGHCHRYVSCKVALCSLTKAPLRVLTKETLAPKAFAARVRYVSKLRKRPVSFPRLSAFAVEADETRASVEAAECLFFQDTLSIRVSTLL